MENPSIKPWKMHECKKINYTEIDKTFFNMFDFKFQVFTYLFQSIFDQLEGEEMRRARTRSNPYETIRGVFFLNR